MAEPLIDLHVDVDVDEVAESIVGLLASSRPRFLQASKESCDSIAAEARGRVARRTGQTAESIEVELSYTGDGYVILAREAALYLEFGLQPQPFLFVSARLEEGSHDARMSHAADDAIADVI